MKKREKKMNKEQKEVRPVKKSVALILTIVTVFAFAAACFSLGFCSGKRVDSAYAANTQHSGGASESSSGSYLYTKTSVKTKLAFSGIFGNTWTPVSFPGLPSFTGSNVWYVGDSIYASSTASTKYQVQYVNNSWTAVTWSGLQPTGSYTFTWDGNIYYFYNNACYILNGTTWSSVLMDGLSAVLSSYFWTDGERLFCSTGSEHYVLDSSSTPTIFNWNTISWTGIAAFRGSGIWSDGTNIYYSSGSSQYVLDTSDYSAEPIVWSGLSSFSGGSIWSDGTNIYYSSGSSSQYVLDVSSRSWSPKQWEGTSTLYGSSFWTDGVNIFHTNGNRSYILERQEDSLYTCTLSENTSGMYSFGYIEGEGVTYNHESGTIKGPADSTFQIQLMPFEGYKVDTFLLTASNGYAKSIVKNSDTLYTITFDNEDFVLNISASVKPITYTLTIQFEGVGFTHTATPTGNSEKISDNVFECDTGSGAYVAIGPQDDYIIEEISYNVDSGVATIQESGVNGYRVLRNSGNAVVTFTVTTKTDSVVISSGYYWLRSFGSPPNYSTRYTISNDDFQAIKSIDDGEIVWESLAGFIPYDECSPWFYFESAPATKVQVFAPGSYRITSVPSGVSNPYSSPVALWYPVVYIPEDIKESRGYSSTLVSFMTGGVYAYKSDIQYYNAFYVELPSTQASIPTSLPSGLSGLTLYTPSQNTVIAPQSVSLTNINNGVIGEWTVYYVVDFAGDPDRGEYTGAWFGMQGGQKRSVYNQFDPFYADGNIYINSTVMPLSVYSFMNSAFNISSVPIDVDPPSADYWIGLDTVLSYQIFGIPLSVLLAVVISSVFVVVVIRLFAGG